MVAEEVRPAVCDFFGLAFRAKPAGVLCPTR